MKASAKEIDQSAGMELELEMGDVLVAYLEQLGIEYVFGVPGGAIEPLYNALARSERRGGPRAVIARHESGAAFMADGYARNTGKLGVCCSTTGPGATNLITGVASAYENNVPMLVITAQTAISSFGKGAIQDSSCTGINTVGIFQHFTRYNSLVSHINQFEHKLASAVLTATQSPAGPSHISIPRDVMAAKFNSPMPNYNLLNLADRPTLLDEKAVSRLYDELVNSRKLVFIVGNQASEAIGSILNLAVALEATILVTPDGKGLVSPYHPLFKGVVGFGGHSSAKELLSDCQVDTVVAIGARFGEFSSNAWDTQILMNNRLIHVESCETNLTRTPMAKLHVRGSLPHIFDRITDQLNASSQNLIESHNEISDRTKDSFKRHFRFDDELGYCSDASPIKPQRLMRELPRLFPPTTRYLADSGNSFAWCAHYLHPFDRRIQGKRSGHSGLFSTTMDFASMGWAIGSAVGTAFALPDIPVVCITGDGSMLMSGQEITVAVQEKLLVIFVVLNDSAYGMVKHGQLLTGAENIGYELPFVDFAALGTSMGVQSYVINEPADLANLDIERILASGGPTLLDVRIDRDEVPPINLRTRVLKNFK